MSSWRRLLPVLTGLVFVGIWYAVHFSLSTEERYLLPRPDAILQAFSDEGAVLGSATLNTALGALCGFAAAIVVSVACALLLSLSPLIRASLYPFLMMLQMTPIILLASILILWSGP